MMREISANYKASESFFSSSFVRYNGANLPELTCCGNETCRIITNKVSNA